MSNDLEYVINQFKEKENSSQDSYIRAQCSEFISLMSSLQEMNKYPELNLQSLVEVTIATLQEVSTKVPDDNLCDLASKWITFRNLLYKVIGAVNTGGLE